jgi:DNA modification methylase
MNLNYNFNIYITKMTPTSCSEEHMEKEEYTIHSNIKLIANIIANTTINMDQTMEHNSYYVGNNLEYLNKMSSESIDLIYFDPPYNTGRNFFDFDDKFKSIADYINFIKLRIIECSRVLKKNGNIVIHIEPKISHYFRFICDEVFGLNNFKNEIVWQTGGNAKNKYQLKRFHDTIIVYSKKGKGKAKFNPLYFPYDDKYRKKSNVKYCDIHKKEYVTTALHNSQPNVNPRLNLRYAWNEHNRQWYVTKEKMQKLHEDNRLAYNKKGVPRIKRFLDEMSGIPLRDVWTDITNVQRKEKLKYATQKPVKLLERILSLYSNENDVCMDIFAGSGTLGRACINQNRKYILIDINEKGKNVFLESIM